MKKNVFVALFNIVLIAAFALSGCATPTAAPQPTAAPAQPTAAAAEPTTAPAQPTAAPAAKAELTIWHGYHTGGSEEVALTQIVQAYMKANPDVTINVLAIPFDQIFNKWETEVAAGGGPDMFTAPNDNLGNEVRAGLVADVTDKLQGKLDGFAQLAIDGLTVEGKLYAVPLIPKAVALYYNKSTIPTPPATTDDLMALVKGGKKLLLNASAYHNYGWFGAFGGAPWNDKGECVNSQTVADAYTYLAALNAADPNIFQTDGSKIDSLFSQGQADMTVGGPWSLGDYEKALGDKLGVVPMPAGPKGNAGPLMGMDGWYINPNSKNVDAAIAAALFFANKDSQTIYADVAGDPPARTDVAPKDALVKNFADAAVKGVARPQTAWFGNFWGPFGDDLTKLIGGKQTPADAAVEACTSMNKANKIDVAVPAPAAAAAAAPQPTAAPAATAVERGGPKEIILATTTSTRDSGLLDVLLPVFEKASGYTVKMVAVGSGQALQMGQDGNADVLLVHSPAAEKTFMDKGYGKERLLVMHNDFIIVGPADDPAKIKGMKSSVDAFKAIATAEATFVSRGDKSGTNSAELAIWKKAAITPTVDSKWYLSTGQGMGDTLNVTNEKGGYTLTDRATYLAKKNTLQLDILVEGDISLLNIYHVITLNTDKYPAVNQAGGQAFADFMVAADTQALIGKFGMDKYSQPLFFPDAGKNEADLGK